MCQWTGRCPGCGEQDRADVFEDFGEVQMRRCTSCDLVFADPMSYTKREWYRDAYLKGDMRFSETVQLGHSHSEFLKHKPLRRGKLLDIGCATGRFVYEARRAGLDAYGIDYDDAAIRIGARVFGLDTIYCLTLEDLIQQKSEEKFDLVTAFEVLEHINDPEKFVGMVRQLLQSAGILVVAVPNRERNRVLYEDTIRNGFDVPPHHLTKWSRKALAHFLQAHGFEVMAIKDIGKIRNIRLPPLYIGSMLRARSLRLRERAAEIDDLHVNLALLRSVDRLANCRIALEKMLLWPVEKVFECMGEQRVTLYAVCRLA